MQQNRILFGEYAGCGIQNPSFRNSSALRGGTFPLGRKSTQKKPTWGKRSERRRWRKKRGERGAAVDKIEHPSRCDDFIGHRNREAIRVPPVEEEAR